MNKVYFFVEESQNCMKLMTIEMPKVDLDKLVLRQEKGLIK